MTDKERLGHIYEAINKIEFSIAGISKDNFLMIMKRKMLIMEGW